MVLAGTVTGVQTSEDPRTPQGSGFEQNRSTLATSLRQASWKVLFDPES